MSKTTAGYVRLLTAALAAAALAIGLGPDDPDYRSFAYALAALVLLGGWVHTQADEGALMGRIATGALGLLLLAPVVGIRVRMVADALTSVDSTLPHTAVASLPSTAADVVHTTGPLMAGAGLALLILGGRLGGPVTGALLGGATAAWAGHTLAAALDRAIGAERFDDLVMLAQGLRFVGLIAIFGAIAGVGLARRGRKDLVARRLTDLVQSKRQAVIDERAAKKAENKRVQAEAEAEESGAAKEAESGEDGALIEFDDEELDPKETERIEAISTTLYAAPLLHLLDDEEIHTIAPSFTQNSLEDGDDLFVEGDEDQSVYIIGRGEIQIWKAAEDKPRFLLARLSAGMMFGEMAVVEKRPRSAGASSFGPVDLISLTSEAYESLTESSPGLIAKLQTGLIQVMAERLRKTSLDLLRLAQGELGSADDKVPTLAKRRGSKVKEDDLGKLLEPARLFSSIDKTEHSALSMAVELVDFKDGDHLCAVGTNEKLMYLITEGRVQIWRRNEQGQKVELAILGPGAPVGEMALFEDELRSSNATTIGDMKALRITRKALSRLIDGHPEIAVKLNQAFLETLSARLRNTSASLVEVAAPTRPPPGVVGVAPPDSDVEEEEEEEEENELLDFGEIEAFTGDDEDYYLDEDEDEDEEADDNLSMDLGELGPKAEGEDTDEPEEPIHVEVHADEVNPDIELTQEQYKRHHRTATGLAVLAALTAYWAASPPWLSLVQKLPSPATGIDVPKTEPGLPNAQRPMNPFGADFAAALERRGHKRMHSRPWPCLPDVYDKEAGYGSHPRKTETLAVSADTPVLDLAPAIIDMRKRGVYRMGLSGSAEPPFGPLGGFLAWPTVQLLVDSPPRTVQWITLSPTRVEKLSLLPGARQPTSCAIIVDGDVTVDHLYATARSLGSVYGDPSCQQAMVLVLPEDGSTTNSHPGWKGCP